METILIGSKPSELTGTGLEYLVVQGLIIAKFYDGSFVTDTMEKPNKEETLNLSEAA
jgi:hypothetical protein